MKPRCLAVMSANFYCVWNQMKPRCLAVMSEIPVRFLLRREAWKFFQDFNGIWTRDLAIPVRCSNQLSYEATDVGSWSLLSSQLHWLWQLVTSEFTTSRSNYVIRNQMKARCLAIMSERYIWNTSYIALRVWNQMKPRCLAVMSANFYCVEKPEKFFQDFNGIWTRDLAIPVRCSNQLSYEATDVGSWSLLSSQLPVISNYEWKIYMKYIIYCTAGMKSNETTLSRSDERKFLLGREAWKIFSGLQRDLNPRRRDTGAML